MGSGSRCARVVVRLLQHMKMLIGGAGSTSARPGTAKWRRSLRRSTRRPDAQKAWADEARGGARAGSSRKGTAQKPTTRTGATTTSPYRAPAHPTSPAQWSRDHTLLCGVDGPPAPRVSAVGKLATRSPLAPRSVREHRQARVCSCRIAHAREEKVHDSDESGQELFAKMLGRGVPLHNESQAGEKKVVRRPLGRRRVSRQRAAGWRPRATRSSRHASGTGEHGAQAEGVGEVPGRRQHEAGVRRSESSTRNRQLGGAPTRGPRWRRLRLRAGRFASRGGGPYSAAPYMGARTRWRKRVGLRVAAAKWWSTSSSAGRTCSGRKSLRGQARGDLSGGFCTCVVEGSALGWRTGAGWGLVVLVIGGWAPLACAGQRQ